MSTRHIWRVLLIGWPHSNTGKLCSLDDVIADSGPFALPVAGQAPGAVTDDLLLWLRADQEVYQNVVVTSVAGTDFTVVTGDVDLDASNITFNSISGVDTAAQATYSFSTDIGVPTTLRTDGGLVFPLGTETLQVRALDGVTPLATATFSSDVAGGVDLLSFVPTSTTTIISTCRIT